MKITEVLSELDIPFKRHGEHHHVSSNWVGVDCPYCSPDSHKFRMGIHTFFHSANCWVCGVKSLYEVLRDIKGTTNGLSALLKGVIREKPGERPVGKLVIPTGVGELQTPHLRYLARRRFDSEDLVRLWGIQGIGIAPRLSWRIWIPIVSRGKTISWTTRAIGENQQRYVTAKPHEESIPSKNLLYGEDYTRNAILIVEGPTDAWRMGPGCVALCGLSYSKSQLNRILHYPMRVILFDSSPDAQKRANQLCEDLGCFDGKTYRVELDSEDPGEASEKEVKKIRKHFLE